MVSSVSNISTEQVFKPLTAEAIKAPHKTQGVYNQPQSDAVEITAENTQEPKKKNRFWRGLGKLIVAAAVIGGGLVAINKKTSWFTKIEKYGGKQLEIAANWTEKNAIKAWDGIKQGFNWVKTKLTPKAKTP